MYKLLLGLLGLLTAAALAPVVIIVFSAPIAPPAMASVATSRPIITDLPAPRHFQARDGASLQYYAYPAGTDKVAVLIHGSAFPATSMHALAQALHAAGITAYVPDIRGHGGSGRRGDIDYIGQIDDDLADFVAQLGPARSGEIRTLVGFSAGAGFTVRFAGGPYGLLFDRYVCLAPILPGAPTLRPSAGGWTSISLPRVMTIASLDRLGIHWFDGYPVLSYAVSPEMSSSVTASYSYRLSLNFGAGRQYESYLRHIRRSAVVLVGEADEQVIADQFAPLMRRLGLNIPVTVVPRMKHADMIRAPEALQVVASVIAPRTE
ncbi:alpha/beta hydrolase [Bradyrhizobium prioriisuperbiae]|uniref:alpha/beta hydrolase n=1 Tax=Bradyrhizobium prioriisuperbiae TaxID=2854389 RepID=UPI0028E31841|nr:alpha/beta hydrolase [Bradyrhizobium prioritasuperba]